MSLILIYTDHSIRLLKSHYFSFSSALPRVAKRDHDGYLQKAVPEQDPGIIPSVPKQDPGILPSAPEQDPGILESIEETLGMLCQ